MNVSDIRHRERLPFFLNEYGLVGTMAEIGCAFGGYSRTVCSSWKGKRYIMVDPWVRQPKEVYKERTEGIDYDFWFNHCKKFAASDSRVELIKAFSVDAAPKIPDGSLDCVYLDGNHAREAIAKDLELWWPKVRSGGIFGGHDFYTALTDGYWNEVDGPVKEFVFAKNLPLVLTPCSSWWVEKP